MSCPDCFCDIRPLPGKVPWTSPPNALCVCVCVCVWCLEFNSQAELCLWSAKLAPHWALFPSPRESPSTQWPQVRELILIPDASSSQQPPDTHACVCTCARTHVDAREHARTHAQVHTDTCTRTRADAREYMDKSTCTWTNTHARTHTHIHLHKYTCTSMRMHKHA